MLLKTPLVLNKYTEVVNTSSSPTFHTFNFIFILIFTVGLGSSPKPYLTISGFR